MVLPTIMPSTRRARAIPDDVVELAERDIGRDLDQDRCRSGFPADAGARVDHARGQLVEHVCLLQVAQAGRVGRRDVDGEIAHHRREHLDQLHIVGDAVGAVLVGADIDADDAALIRTRREPAQHRVGALAVEAEPVDDALVARQPKHARARIASLRPRRHGADLDEAEAELEQCIGHLGVLVEPRRHPDRIREIESEGAHRKPRIVRHQLDEGRDLQRQDGEPVRVLGIEQAQQRPRELFEQSDHGVSSGNTWPSAGIEPQRFCPQHRGERQRTVEMRKHAPPRENSHRRAPAERISIDRHQHQVVGTGEMLAPRSPAPARRSRNG